MGLTSLQLFIDSLKSFVGATTGELPRRCHAFGMKSAI